jgi:hypothetical protein
VTNIDPSITVSPGLTNIDVIVPEHSASMLFCIFIASSTRIVSPSLTLSPTFTLTDVIVPGRGDFVGVPVPAGAAGLFCRGCGAQDEVLGSLETVDFTQRRALVS